MKGSILDTFGFAVTVLVMSIVVVLVAYAAHLAISSAVPAFNETSPEIAEVVQTGDTVTTILVNAVPFIFVGMMVGALLMAYFIPTHPIFLPLSVLLLAISVFVSFYFSDVLYEFFHVEGISSYLNNFPLIVFMGKNLPLIVFGFGLLLIIVMYVRRGVENVEL